jgi:hypothetical protein
MDLEKIKKLIEFVGSSRVSELTVSQEGTTVRITAGAIIAAPARCGSRNGIRDTPRRRAGAGIRRSRTGVIRHRRSTLIRPFPSRPEPGRGAFRRSRR